MMSNRYWERAWSLVSGCTPVSPIPPSVTDSTLRSVEAERDAARRWAGVMYRRALKAEAMLDEVSDTNEELARERDAYWQRVKQLEAQVSV